MRASQALVIGPKLPGQICRSVAEDVSELVHSRAGGCPRRVQSIRGSGSALSVFRADSVPRPVTPPTIRKGMVKAPAAAQENIAPRFCGRHRQRGCQSVTVGRPSVGKGLDAPVEALVVQPGAPPTWTGASLTGLR